MAPPTLPIPAAGAPAAERRGWLRRFYGSAVGKKIVMALTGVILVGFLVVHLAGNLLVFQGAEALNEYAEFLKKSAPVVWTVRAVLLAAIVLHVHAAVTLTRQAQRARPQRYVTLRARASTPSARLMRIGGVVLAAFIGFHLLHLTVGSVHPDFVPGDAFHNVVTGLRAPAVAGFYVVAMAALALHLHHGVWSLLQTLGANHPHVNPARRHLARVLAVVLGLGFAAIPVAVVAGLVR